MTVPDDGPPPRRVLIVDDEEAIRSALRRFFTRRGWEVDEAPDGEQALVHLLAGDQAVPYDVVVSDMRMPRLTGEELYDRLAVARPELLPRCIFSTGDASSAEAVHFLARTQCRALEKPFELARLTAMLEEIPPR